jgi:drug/metabolite transporter (DMT)-like permease
MKLTRLPIEAATLLYVSFYIPYMVIARALSSFVMPGEERTLSGLETLPPVLILGSVFTLVFIVAMGWHRKANQVVMLGVSLPCPRWSTLLSGVGAAMLLFTVPLSLTFEGVSIPYMQLLMRGDVLLIAPLIDILFGRRVRWWSWVALGLVLIGLALTIGARGGLHLPPLAIVTIVVYTVGYFVRLAVMTRIAKSGREDELEAYFVEEKMVGMPLAILMLAALTFTPFSQGADLSWGFVQVWTSGALPLIVAMAFTFFLISVFSLLILLDPRENTFCVPFERAASILAGVAAAYLLFVLFGLEAPTPAELIGSALLIGAIALLSLAPRWDARRRAPIAARAEGPG